MIAWLSLSLMLGALTYIAAWSRFPTRARGIAVATFMFVVPVSGATMIVQRGLPVQPVAILAELPSGEIQVDGVRMVPGVAILVMLTTAEGSRLYELPWDAQTASELQRMMEGGGEIRAKRKGDRKGNSNDDFDYPIELYDAPQASLPEKQPEAAYEYERDAG